jgi:hypothetical protein
MRTFLMFLLLTTGAHAAPLHLSCKGDGYIYRENREPAREPATISITVDGTNVKVEDLAPVQIYSNDEDVWTFGDPGFRVGWVSWGQINRITGQAQIMIKVTTSMSSRFDGVCHKTEKLF